MNRKSPFQILMRLLAAVVIVFAITGCVAFGPDIIDHSFGFDLRQDNQDADVLNYWYGSPKSPIRANAQQVKEGMTFNVNGITGPMNRPEALYVKWRNRNTGQVYEDTVDLRHRLPKDIAGQRVYFMIYGPQLYVYLISKERRPPDMPPIGPRTYSRSDKITTIYPDQAKP